MYPWLTINIRQIADNIDISHTIAAQLDKIISVILQKIFYISISIYIYSDSLPSSLVIHTS